MLLAYSYARNGIFGNRKCRQEGDEISGLSLLIDTLREGQGSVVYGVVYSQFSWDGYRRCRQGQLVPTDIYSSILRTARIHYPQFLSSWANMLTVSFWGSRRCNAMRICIMQGRTGIQWINAHLPFGLLIIRSYANQLWLLQETHMAGSWTQDWLHLVL